MADISRQEELLQRLFDWGLTSHTVLKNELLTIDATVS